MPPFVSSTCVSSYWEIGLMHQVPCALRESTDRMVPALPVPRGAMTDSYHIRFSCPTAPLIEKRRPSNRYQNSLRFYILWKVFMPFLVGLCYWLMHFWRCVMQNGHIRALIHFLLHIFCIDVKIYLTLRKFTVSRGLRQGSFLIS